MSLCPVRIEFKCEDTFITLSYVHDLPRSLVPVDSRVIQKDSQHTILLEQTVLPIVKEHEVACLAASSLQCGICGSAKEDILQTPLYITHDIGDPILTVWVQSICGKEECEVQAKQKIESAVDEIREDISDQMRSVPNTGMEVKACKVCSKTVGTKRCARCKTVAYCGIEHQKADWKVHKKTCVSKYQGDN